MKTPKTATNPKGAGRRPGTVDMELVKMRKNVVAYVKAQLDAGQNVSIPLIEYVEKLALKTSKK